MNSLAVWAAGVTAGVALGAMFGRDAIPYALTAFLAIVACRLAISYDAYVRRTEGDTND